MTRGREDSGIFSLRYKRKLSREHSWAWVVLLLVASALKYSHTLHSLTSTNTRHRSRSKSVGFHKVFHKLRGTEEGLNYILGHETAIPSKCLNTITKALSDM